MEACFIQITDRDTSYTTIPAQTRATATQLYSIMYLFYFIAAFLAAAAAFIPSSFFW